MEESTGMFIDYQSLDFEININSDSVFAVLPPVPVIEIGEDQLLQIDGSKSYDMRNKDTVLKYTWT